MIVCRDCGTRNRGTEYCRRCGAALFVKRQPQPDRVTRFVRHLFVRK